MDQHQVMVMVGYEEVNATRSRLQTNTRLSQVTRKNTFFVYLTPIPALIIATYQWWSIHSGEILVVPPKRQSQSTLYINTSIVIQKVDVAIFAAKCQ